MNKSSLAYLIREAFLATVPEDEVRVANQDALSSMAQFRITKTDLLKTMKSIQIEEIQLNPGNEIRFTIYPIHRGQPLRIALSAQGCAKSNTLVFWVMSIRPLR